MDTICFNSSSRLGLNGRQISEDQARLLFECEDDSTLKVKVVVSGPSEIVRPQTVGTGYKAVRCVLGVQISISQRLQGILRSRHGLKLDRHDDLSVMADAGASELRKSVRVIHLAVPEGS
jgi:hypothetical protein